ncbi:MAG: hypothetical protein PHI63_00950 [Patescibacteria group bacterium]|nr:hypothetical protein [Patescibacteria group bacterium]
MQTVVRHRLSGRVGVTVPDHFNICIAEETFVVFDGEQEGQGTFTEDLEVVGPEHAVADPVKCGIGTGGNACMFFSRSMSGCHCERFGPDRFRTIASAEQSPTPLRHPAQLYPNCLLPLPSAPAQS